MKNKKLLAVLALTVTASVFMAGCGFGGDEPEEQKVVSVTSAPEVTKAPTATPTIAPNVQNTTYTSADKSVSINLPDATWANKTDESDTISFESPENGNILILHGQGEETMAATVIPSTQDMAVSLEQADGDKVQGTDFEIQDYKAEDVNGIGVYSYVTKMINTEKSDGALYVIHKVFANAGEYYTIEASVKNEAALASVKSAVDSFKILGNSTLKEAAPGTAPAAGASTGTDGAGTAAADNTAGTDAPAAENGGTDTAAGTDAGTSDAAGTDTGSAESTSSGTTSSGGFTEEQLSNTDATRTIYRNSDGHPIVIQPDGNGSWMDFDGNTYNFANDEDVYAEDGTDYYWHGEAADVYYMPVQ
ncbi:MAG: PsbP-related protein [Blautia sp.]|uniref:PsbP-related protein n=1 Tax=Blautia sp. TaxID=1955243 RepID=UPI0039928488